MSQPRSRARRAAAALALASHPAPAAAVTAFAGVLAVGAGAGPSALARVLLAVAVGQLSVGWCNDWWDADRDAAVGRPDKPVAIGRVSRPVVGRAAALAAAGTLPASLLLGWRAAAVHLVAVASAWAYNLWLKGTALSWLPFAVSFGLLPAVATLTVPGQRLPSPAVLLAGGLLGVGAHLVNVLPDLLDDTATGVHGAGHRLGGSWTALLAPACFALAALVVTAGGLVGGRGSADGWADGALLVAVAVASVVAVRTAGRGQRAAALAACATAAASTLLLLLLNGGLRPDR